MGRAIGIDLGTTHSVMAVIRDGRPEVLTNAEGGRRTPSVVAFDTEGRHTVGQTALKGAARFPSRTILSIKREMGRGAPVTIDGIEYTPPQIAARILEKLKADAEAALGETVTHAVITVPSYFSFAQRAATKQAGELAGLHVLRILNEPTSAALAYAVLREDLLRDNSNLLVFDLGGGTLDVSLLQTGKAGVGEWVLHVLSVDGDTELGGDDWDLSLAELLREQFSAEQGADIGDDPVAVRRLRAAAEEAKCTLSEVANASVSLPALLRTPQGTVDLESEVTRSQFERRSFELLQRCKGPLERALSQAGIEPGALNEILVVGGATRMPMIHELLRQVTGRKPLQTVDAFESVAIGAAVQASLLAGDRTSPGKRFLILDVTPRALGVAVGDKVEQVIARNTTVPTTRKSLFTTAHDGQKVLGINLYEGNAERVEENERIGTLLVPLVSAATKGQPEIDVSFSVDADGILKVTATENGSRHSHILRPSDPLDQLRHLVQTYRSSDASLKEMVERHLYLAGHTIHTAAETMLRRGGAHDCSVAAGALAAVKDSRAETILIQALEAGSTMAKLSVLGALCEIGTPASVAAAVAAIACPDVDISLRALEELEKKPRECTLERLSPAVGHASAKVRARAAVTFGRLDGAWAGEALVAMRGDGDPAVRREVVKALGGRHWQWPQECDGAYPTVVRLAADPFPEVRVAAMTALGQLQEVLAVEVLFDAVERDLVPAVRSAAVVALCRFQDTRIIGKIESLLDLPDGDLSLAVIKTMRSQRVPERTTALLKAFNNRHAAVRIEAIKAFMDGKELRAVRPLIEVALSKTSEPEVCDNAAKMLEQFEAGDDLRHRILMSEALGGRGKFKALQALRQWSERSVSPQLQSTNLSQDKLRQWSERSVRHIAWREDVNAYLKKMLRNRDPGIQAAAEQVLEGAAGIDPINEPGNTQPGELLRSYIPSEE